MLVSFKFGEHNIFMINGRKKFIYLSDGLIYICFLAH